MKKRLAILVMVFCISIVSSGCMYIDGKVTVNADGSGFTDFNVGIAKSVLLAAYTIDGNNYFKLRDIGKAIDFWVDWDGENNRVIIDTTIVNSGLVYDDAGNIIDGIKWDTNIPGIPAENGSFLLGFTHAYF